MTGSSWPHERIGIVATIDPQSATAGTYTTDSIDVRTYKYHQFLFTLLLGAAANTTDFKVQESADDSTYSDVSGKSITQLSGSDDNKQASIAIRTDEMGSGKYYLRGYLVTGGTNLVAVAAHGFDPRHTPTSAYDLASVAEMVK